jgi:UDP-N-acetylmuramate dehydrogenase
MNNLDFLRDLPNCLLKHSESARSLTTFGIGGSVENLIEPSNLEAVRELIRQLSSRKLKYRIIGAGSNVVFSDNGVIEPVVRLNRAFGGCLIYRDEVSSLEQLEKLREKSLSEKNFIEDDEISSVKLLAFAACPLMKLSRLVSEQALGGLEFAAGIPASIGGAVAMNAGAHGSEMSSIVDRVFVLNAKGQLRILKNSELNFAYRHSAICREDFVLATVLNLERGNKEAIKTKRKKSLDYRKMTQPLSMPSAGSVFVNPEAKLLDEQKVFSAQLLEHCGLKGVREGSVAYSDMHANWLVRVSDEAKTADFIKLVEQGKKLVQSEFGITLKTEIKIWD